MALKRQDINGGGINHYVESKCPVCGKKFEHTDVWAYWRGYVNNKIFLCTWSCTRKYDAQQPPKRPYRRNFIA